MPWRPVIEHGLHFCAILCMLLVAWQLWQAQQHEQTPVAHSNNLAQDLPLWTWQPPTRGQLQLDVLPDATQRAWLAALQVTGTKLDWQTDAADGQWPASAISAEPVADPTQPVRIWTAGDAKDASLHWSLHADNVELGEIASQAEAMHSTASAVVELPSMEHWAMLEASSGDHAPAQALLQDRLNFKPVLLVAHAGWEARFVTAALEQRGWQVDARLRLSPTQEVTSADIGAMTGTSSAELRNSLSTSNYAAVVVLDDQAENHVDALVEYVQSGGGLIVAGKANHVRGLQAILPAPTLGAATDAMPISGAGGAARQQLAMLPLDGLRPAALVLERSLGSGGPVSVALHRHGQGRVLQMGYLDSWRWPLGAVDEEAPQAYRQWWAELVSHIAVVESFDFAPNLQHLTQHDSAPLAAWYARLGSAATSRGEAASSDIPMGRNGLSADLWPWLFGFILTALLLQWFSRRWRGAP